MRTIVFDTETSGFKPGYICQLSYVISDGGGAPVAGKNHFFAARYVEPGAARVHGFTAEILAELSEGRTFGDCLEEISADLSSAGMLVAHNFDFDKSFLDAEFARAGKTLRYGGWLCTMKHFTPICKLPPKKPGDYRSPYKYPALPELVGYLGISEPDIARLADEAFGQGGRVGAHDARYDSAATYLCYRAALERGLI
jgi:DNA polymerase-3 subunit epsilon